MGRAHRVECLRDVLAEQQAVSGSTAGGTITPITPRARTVATISARQLDGRFLTDEGGGWVLVHRHQITARDDPVLVNAAAYARPMAVVPVQCWMRTFKVEFTGGAASAFVINHRDRQWLITAKHVADAAVQNGVAALTLTGENGLDVELSGPLAPVPLVGAGPDIAVFDLGGKKVVLDNMTLVPSADGVALSQEVFFLGFPLTGTLPLMGRLPAVRRGIVSQRAQLNGVAAWIIDGHNLPGFSGGPLVFANAGGMGSTWHVLGVVSAYWLHRIDVEVAGADLPEGMSFKVPTNAGLVVVYDIKHAIDAIDAFVDTEG
ncbi:hypothetical protein TUM20983_34980 [Mycobacterium antarcticum]|uniref:S1 family peptidase n=1 Tax=Mycolicibacterium sp. TUM20983 TaxID=3023369 RepID=UPI00239AE91B|nr:serine protease [Mycolicibacterium sp. TUM20983]GLP76388.1 hypothetical protein TUM20983_34980 [Mycolicibacterium sp. TUM20983]